jgi:hypothetical protein
MLMLLLRRGGRSLRGLYRAGGSGEESYGSDHGGGCGKNDGCESQGGRFLAGWAADLTYLTKFYAMGLDLYGSQKDFYLAAKFGGGSV